MPRASRWTGCRIFAIIVAVIPPTLLNVAARGESGKTEAQATAPGMEQLTVYLGQSKVVPAPWAVKRVSVTDPEIAGVQVLTPAAVLVQGKALGTTDLFLWSAKEDLWHTKVRVIVDVERLKIELDDLFPGSKLNVSQSQNTVVIAGMLGRAEHARQLKTFMKSSGLNYVDVTSVAGVQQVMLQVRIAEATRTTIHALGFTSLVSDDHFLGALNLGPEEGGTLTPLSVSPPPTTFTGTIAVSPIFLAYVHKDLSFFVQALATNNMMRILAEPTLVALSGEEATFLVGGEFPVPVVRATVLDKPTISVQFKEYGIRLRFKPTALGDGSIRLLVCSEVSQLSRDGAIEVSGFFIPSLIARKAETTLELKSGQSFAMAGLLLSTVEEQTSGIPGLADLPVIGALFRSIRYKKGETDLVVLATVWLVEPLVAGEQVRMLTDWERFVLGDVEGEVPARVSQILSQRLAAMGFHLLRGSGAWDAGQMEIIESRQTTYSPQGAGPRTPGQKKK